MPDEDTIDVPAWLDDPSGDETNVAVDEATDPVFNPVEAKEADEGTLPVEEAEVVDPNKGAEEEP